MAGHRIDLTGQKFGRLTAIKRTKPNYWMFKCDCGNKKECRANNVKRGLIQSCGCYLRESAGDRVRTHGKSNTALFNKWLQMRKRCNCPKIHGYHNYGGRGIKVCKEWDDSFEAFSDWAEQNGYKEGLSIDRINPDGNYCPDNCRWATKKEQDNNKRTSVKVLYKGEEVSLSILAEKFNLPRWKVYSRVKHYKWPIEKAISVPVIALFLLAGCARTTSVQIKPVCPPMLREATYKAMQADEVADYRIAVEKCRVFQ